MLASPTLSVDQFKTIHNALCNLDTVLSKLSGVVADKVSTQLNEAIEDIRGALSDAYAADHHEYDTRSAHYDNIKFLMKLHNSEWSMYEVADMRDGHKFGDVDRVVYMNHWGTTPVQASVDGSTWMSLWRAADECIKLSGDRHHVFIENFVVSPDDPRTLILSTGS